MLAPTVLRLRLHRRHRLGFACRPQVRWRGVLRDIRATHGALQLSELVRFKDPAEGAASPPLPASPTLSDTAFWMMVTAVSFEVLTVFSMRSRLTLSGSNSRASRARPALK